MVLSSYLLKTRKLKTCCSTIPPAVIPTITPAVVIDIPLYPKTFSVCGVVNANANEAHTFKMNKISIKVFW